MLPQAVIDALSARLAALPDLRLPAQLRQGDASDERKRDYLTRLLQHDPGVFLERHGSDLTADERRAFECLRGDYEVRFYLRFLEEQQDAGKQATVARNRRVAYMNRLEAEGAYFSEKDMRERQPGLYHHFIGQYRPPELPSQDECQAGCILAQSIMAQQEELDLRQRQAADQQRWQQQAEESESEEESEDEEELPDGKGAAQRQVQQQRQEQTQQAAAGGGGPQGQQGGAPPASGQPGGDGAGPAAAAEQGEGEAAAEAAPNYIHISEAEAQENAAAFLDVMRQRFLAGQDAGVDYAAIDADAELDDDWAATQQQDAEDAYFADA